MALSLHLQIEQRRPDRVFVLIELGHQGTTLNVTGAAVELRSQRGVLLSPRMLLPISGLLAGPLATRVELRSQIPIPQGSKVYGIVFWDGEQTEAVIPADPCTELEAHVRGTRNIVGVNPKELENLDPMEEYELQRYFPWAVNDELDDGDEDDLEDDENDENDEDDKDQNMDELTDEVAKSLGLDAEEAAFLREILTDEVPLQDP
jgi:hypothetical protein